MKKYELKIKNELRKREAFSTAILNSSLLILNCSGEVFGLE
jgi:hypothetical protein